MPIGLGVVAVVFTDIELANMLWIIDAQAMAIATDLHNKLLRSLLSKYSVSTSVVLVN